MKKYKFFETKNGRKIAYKKVVSGVDNETPGVIFLGGFKSDMSGTKAQFLEGWALENKVPFIRFDYSGHGKSEGKFIDGCISDWKEDALNVLDELSTGPQVLVGSSMGGWIALLLAKLRPERIKGLVGIATAPDFTEDSIWHNLDKVSRERLMKEGHIELPSSYSEEPLLITKKLIEDGRKNLILTEQLTLNCPLRFLQGMQDLDVHFSQAIRLSEFLGNDDIQVKFVKRADHSFSSDECLFLVIEAINSLIQVT